MSSLTIHLPEQLETRLRAGADRCGLSLDDFVRPALEALAHCPAEELEELVVAPLQQDADRLMTLMDEWDAQDAAREGPPIPPPSIPRSRFRELNLG